MLELPSPFLYGKGGNLLDITARVNLTITVDDYTVTVPVFVQPDSAQECLLGMNVLPQLGIKIHRANGKSLQQVGGTPEKAEVRLVHSVVIPSHHAKLVTAQVEVPLKKGDQMVFEPNLNRMQVYGVIAPESLVTLQSEGHILLPLENDEGLDARLDRNTPIGHVEKYDLCDSCIEKARTAQSEVLQVQACPSPTSTTSMEARK